MVAASKFSTGRRPTRVNPLLVKERGTATFDVETVTNIILDNGSIEQTQRRRYLEGLIENDPSGGVFSNDNNAYMSRTERHVNGLAKHVRLIELCRASGICDSKNGEITNHDDFHILVNSISDILPTNLHWAMFLPNLQSLCDDEQLAEWLPLCRDWKMIGCYAQTELGHGSNVRGLETTATYVKDSDQWCIHSPTLTSTKFWPGTLGRTGNHAMVIARLIDGDGMDRGIHNFLVPIRCMDTHQLLPGIKTGDIGPKIGYNNMDNGYCIFDHVLIPRRNMAMRYATVDANGKYTKKKVSAAASKISYITMMQVRALLVEGVGKLLAMACTISIRYSAVRLQGFDEASADGKKGKTEVQILDYKQQQHRLLPLLASSFCFFVVGKKSMLQLKHMEQTIQQSPNDITKTQVSDIHAKLSALKSISTMIASDGVEDCRKACGGHGFLQCSGLPELAGFTVHTATVEGDNHMLPQQVLKVLLKLVNAIHNQDERAIHQWQSCDSNYLIPPLHQFIHDGDTTTATTTSPPPPKKFGLVTKDDDTGNVQHLLCAYQHRSARLVWEVAKCLEGSVMEGKSMETAWNDALVQMARASRAHAMYLLLRGFVDTIHKDFHHQQNKEQKVMMDLVLLFGFYWMEKDMSDFVEDNYVNNTQANMVRQCVLQLLDVLRPNAVALVDAWDFSDFRLRSALGRYDGNVYPAILESSKKDSLNATEPGPGYDPHLRRLIVDGVGVYTGTASRL